MSGELNAVDAARGDWPQHLPAEQKPGGCEERYRRLLASVTDYIYTVYFEAGQPVRTEHGQGCVAITGYAREEFEADPMLWSRMIPEEDRARVEEMVGRITAGEVPPPAEHRIRRKDGSIRWVRNTSSLHLDGLGHVKSYDGLISDVTERKDIEERLRQSEALYQSLVESLPHLILRKDLEGRITFANLRYAEFKSVAPDDLLGRTDWDLYSEEVARKHRAEDQQVVRTGAILEAEEEEVGVDGKVRHLHVVKVPVQSQAGAVSGIQCIVSDITERRAAERELRHSEGRFQAFMDHTPAVVYLKDLAGRYQYVNKRFEEIVGRDRQSVLGKTDRELLPGEVARQLREHDELVLQLGRAEDFDEEVPYGQEMRSYVSIKFPIFNGGGHQFAVGGISTDITERKRAMEELERKNVALQQTNAELTATRIQLIQAEKWKSIGTLAAGVAHEVKNPLQILLLGVSDLARRRTQPDGEEEQTLKEMREAIERANNIIGDLLDFSRLKQLEPEPSDVNEVVRGALRLVQFKLVEAHIEVESELAPGLPRLVLDRQKIQQVLLNVVNNAIEAMGEGGQLNIRTRSAASREDKAGPGESGRWAAEERLVIVEVEDTGPGIAPEELPRVFDPFFTSKAPGEGTGLGLFVAQNIIGLHGGVIEIQNRSDRAGARVTITLASGMCKVRQQHEKDANSSGG